MLLYQVAFIDIKLNSIATWYYAELHSLEFWNKITRMNANRY